MVQANTYWTALLEFGKPKPFTMKGFDPHFLGKNFEVKLPDYSAFLADLARNQQNKAEVLDYIYYSIVQSKSRRVPLLSASNIFRTGFKQAGRVGSFKKDRRLKDAEQLTNNDYKKFNKIKPASIEKGHMTKREDVQWDINGNIKKAEAAAKSTFYYPNATPQHDSLNNGIWKHLENAIIIKGRVEIPAKVCVLTGPVLDEQDPEFLIPLHDKSVFQIPVLFWKVVYYVKPDNKLYCAGFLMGQMRPLKRDCLIKVIRHRGNTAKKTSILKPFLKFEEDEKYQLSIALIEKLTRLKFHKAIDLHKAKSPTKLKIIDIQARSGKRRAKAAPPEIEGLLV